MTVRGCILDGNVGGQLSGEWIDKTEAFLNGAFAKLKGGNITWCSCNKCGNTRRQTREVMMNHLCMYTMSTISNRLR